MSIPVNPHLLDEIKKYGAFDISACFNCGNCTAVCPLSENGASFPRKMIRFGQIGVKSEILKAKEPWLCYYCAECSETCPRQAEPGEYMASLRRYQIATLDVTGLGKLMYKHAWFAFLFSIVTASLLATLLVKIPNGKSPTHWLFGDLVQYSTIHDIGIGLAVLLTALITISFFNLTRRSEILKNFHWKKILAAKIEVLLEIGLMKRHGKCHEEAPRKMPWYTDPRFVHLGIMWGFLMLAGATGLDFLLLYLLPLALDPIPGFLTAMGLPELFYPARFLGTIGGIIMLWGVSTALYKRFTKTERASAKTRFADAWLLIYLWILAVTGFWLEIVVTLTSKSLVNDWVLLIHAAMAMQLILFMGMTKLGHAIYRPFMLIKHTLDKQGESQ
jgi:ferredoxin